MRKPRSLQIFQRSYRFILEMKHSFFLKQLLVVLATTKLPPPQPMTQHLVFAKFVCNIAVFSTPKLSPFQVSRYKGGVGVFGFLVLVIFQIGYFGFAICCSFQFSPFLALGFRFLVIRKAVFRFQLFACHVPRPLYFPLVGQSMSVYVVCHIDNNCIAARFGPFG